jgi:ankyrin repeat protein
MWYIYLLCMFLSIDQSALVKITSYSEKIIYLKTPKGISNYTDVIRNNVKECIQQKKDLNSFIMLDCDKRSKSMFLYDVCKDDALLDVAQKLLENGANPHRGLKVDEHLQTPLHIAVKSLLVETVKLLLTYNVNVNAVDSRGCSPLHILLEHTHYTNEQDIILQLLFDKRANPNMRNWCGQTPLFTIARYGGKQHTPLVTRLITHDADITIKDRYDQTAIKYGREKGVTIDCADLIEKKAKAYELFKLLWRVGKKGYSPFRALPKEIVMKIVDL